MILHDTADWVQLVLRQDFVLKNWLKLICDKVIVCASSQGTVTSSQVPGILSLRQVDGGCRIPQLFGLPPSDTQQEMCG